MPADDIKRYPIEGRDEALIQNWETGLRRIWQTPWASKGTVPAVASVFLLLLAWIVQHVGLKFAQSELDRQDEELLSVQAELRTMKEQLELGRQVLLNTTSSVAPAISEIEAQVADRNESEWNGHGKEPRRLQFVGPAWCTDSSVSQCKRANVFKYCGMWSIVSGDCTTDGEDCLMSPNFGQAVYGPAESCTVKIRRGYSQPIESTRWELGAGDTLKIDPGEPGATDREFDMTREPKYPNYVMPVKEVIWSSDSSNQAYGWRICPVKPKDGSTPKTLEVVPRGPETICVVDSDGKCAHTAGLHYKMRSASQWCKILIRGKQSLRFQTKFCVICRWSPGLFPPPDSEVRIRITKGTTDTLSHDTFCGSSSVSECDENCNIMYGLYRDVSTITDVTAATPFSSNIPFSLPNTAGELELRTPSNLGDDMCDGFNFCLDSEDLTWRESLNCPRTCGRCIETYEKQLLRQCIDDVAFLKGCIHFAQEGTGTPTGYTGTQKCTIDSAKRSLDSWINSHPSGQGADIQADDVDRMFIKRLWQHCPFSCRLCEKCAPGRYVVHDTSSALKPGVCADCAAGKYTDLEHQTNCRSCADGHSSNASSATCSPCVVGKFAKSIDAQACKACQHGRFQNETGRKECKPCTFGRYQDSTAASMCQPCPTGKFSDTNGATGCAECMPGTFTDGTGANFCSNCAPGKFQNASVVVCQNCSRGYYSSLRSATMCVPCSIGMYIDVVGSTLCAQCRQGGFSDERGRSGCFNCPTGYTTPFPGAQGIRDCECPPNTYNIENTTTCARCPAGFTCPGGHGYGNASLDISVLLNPGYMSLPEEPLKAFTCKGLWKVCHGYRTPMFRTEAKLWSQVCGGGRMGQACAECASNHFMTESGCEQCVGLDKTIFYLAMPGFLLGLICLHVMWNKPSIKEDADKKAAMVCVNLYLLYSQILGVFQSVRITWKAPFKQFLEFSSYLALRLEFLKPSCGMHVSPTRAYVTRGMLPLCGMGAIWGVFLVCHSLQKVAPDLEEKLPIPLRSWLYYVNTTGAIYIAFSSSIAFTSFLPWQCMENPGESPDSHHEWPSVICEWDDATYASMSAFGFFIIIVYIISIPMFCIYQVLRYPVAIATDPNFFTKYKFLFHHYSAEARFYSLVIMVRNVSLSAISVFLQRDTFFQVICMMFVMILYLTATCLCWPWTQYHINWLDICSCVMLLGIMTIGSGFIEDEINQHSLLVLLSIFFVLLALAFFSTMMYYALSHFGGRYDYTVFLSHAKGNGGAVARLFKTVLSSRLAFGSKIFVDSDDLVSLHELHVFVQHTRNLVLLLTPNCFAREWVAVEIVTTYVHSVHALMVSINEGAPPDEAFIDNIPNVFRSNLTGRFPSLGIDADLLRAAFTSIQDAPMLSFDVYSSMEMQEEHIEELVGRLALGTSSLLKSRFLRHAEYCADFLEVFVQKQFGMFGTTNIRIRSMPSSVKRAREDITEFTRIFICRDKSADVQQEAAVLCLKLELNDILMGSVYLPPHTYSFQHIHERIVRLQRKGSVILFCLTKTVLLCLPAICEVVTAVQNGMSVVPVQVDPDFMYPGDPFYESMANGEVLPLTRRTDVDLIYRAVSNLLKTLFEEIALPFNANASDTSIKISAKSIETRYMECQKREAVGQLLCRLEDSEVSALKSFIHDESSGRYPSSFSEDSTHNINSSGPANELIPKPEPEPQLYGQQYASGGVERKPIKRPSPKPKQFQQSARSPRGKKSGIQPLTNVSDRQHLERPSFDDAGALGNALERPSFDERVRQAANTALQQHSHSQTQGPQKSSVVTNEKEQLNNLFQERPTSPTQKRQPISKARARARAKAASPAASPRSPRSPQSQRNRAESDPPVQPAVQSLQGLDSAVRPINSMLPPPPGRPKARRGKQPQPRKLSPRADPGGKLSNVSPQVSLRAQAAQPSLRSDVDSDMEISNIYNNRRKQAF